MNTAVILAAGMGTRLREAHADLPKGFLELGGQSLIERSIALLEQAGITDIIIVTGHLAEHYQQLAERYPGLVRTVHNADYAESGSMYSLYCARELIEQAFGPLPEQVVEQSAGGVAEESFLLLESDLLYESRALSVLLEHASADAILLSGQTNAGDEVYVEAPQGMLVDMSKVRSELGSVAGELVGISKISRGLFTLMKQLAHEQFHESLQYAYETDCLVAAGQSREIPCPVVADLIWTEIDDPAHLERALREILPKLS